VKKQIHPGDGGRGQIFFLPEQFAPKRAVVTVVGFNMVGGFEQHAAGATRRIVNGFALFGVEDIDHQAAPRAWGVKFTRLFVGGVGEFLDEVFVGLAEDVPLPPPDCRD
jgi:hypothetical protein